MPMALNILLNISLTYMFIQTGFAEPLAGLALATTLSALTNTILLQYVLRRRMKTTKGGGVGRRAWFALLPASVPVLFLLWRLSPSVNDFSKSGLLPGIASMLGVISLAFILFLLLFGVIGGSDARHFFKLIVNRVRRRT